MGRPGPEAGDRRYRAAIPGGERSRQKEINENIYGKKIRQQKKKKKRKREQEREREGERIAYNSAK